MYIHTHIYIVWLSLNHLMDFKGLNYPNWSRILFRNWMFWFRLHQKFKCSIRNVTCALNSRVYCNPWKITQNSNPSHSIIGTLNNKWRNAWWINLSMKKSTWKMCKKSFNPWKICPKDPSFWGWSNSFNPNLGALRKLLPRSPSNHGHYFVGPSAKHVRPERRIQSLGGGPLERGRFLLGKPPFFRGCYVSFQGCIKNTTNIRMFGKNLISWTENTNELMSI